MIWLNALKMVKGSLRLKYLSFLEVSIRPSIQKVLRRFGYQANLSLERDSADLTVCNTTYKGKIRLF